MQPRWTSHLQPQSRSCSCVVQSNRLGDDISFSEAGGVEIEENWDKVKKITLATDEAATTESLAPLLSSLPLELRPDMENFIQACYEASPCALETLYSYLLRSFLMRTTRQMLP